MPNTKSTREMVEGKKEEMTFQQEVLKFLDNINTSLSKILEKFNSVEEDKTNFNLQCFKLNEILSSLPRETKESSECASNDKKGNFTTASSNERSVALDEKVELTESQLIKEAMISNWNRKLKERRISFWNYLKNKNTAECYYKWIASEVPIIPKKFQMKYIKSESKAEQQIREQVAMHKFKSEIELLKLRAESHKVKFQSIDEEMRKILQQKSEGKTLQEIVEMWKDECRKEQDKSTIKLEKNRSWQEKYATEFTAEHQASNPFIKTYADAIKSNTQDSADNTRHEIRTPGWNIRGYNRNNPCQSQNTFYKVQYSRNSRQNIKQSVAADQTHKTNTHAQGNRDFRHVNRKWRTR